MRKMSSRVFADAKSISKVVSSEEVRSWRQSGFRLWLADIERTDPVFTVVAAEDADCKPHFIPRPVLKCFQDRLKHMSDIDFLFLLTSLPSRPSHKRRQLPYSKPTA